MNAEHRRLLSRATKAEDDVQLLRERLAAAYLAMLAFHPESP
jgi:hypothetical protein